jgi:hypothetical protein
MMQKRYLALLAAGTVVLTACTPTEPPAPPPPPPPLGPGAIVGTMAADRNGDGIVDGWYTADGVFHPFIAPPCPPPPPPPLPPPPPRSGERG